MVNNVVLIGRLTKDPEQVRKTQSGHSILSFNIAVDRRFAQEGQEEADFIKIKAWRQRADFVSRYLNKGDLIAVEGRIETGSYLDKAGQTVYTTEVVADNIESLETKEAKEARLAKQGQYIGRQQQDQRPASRVSSSGYGRQQPEEPEEEYGGPTLDITSDDLPF